MRTERPEISLFVKNQFPDFYHRDGEAFVAFVQAYYEWLGQENNVGDLTSKIYNLRDIDLTIDDFVDYFKNKYLNNFQATPQTNIRTMVKHAVELFGAKGTEQSIKLLFQLLYGQEVEIYRPGNDILRADDGKWFRARYLEVSPTSKIKEYLFKTIQGASSGATAYVESAIRKSIDGRIVDVVYLSNLRGLFQAGERITVDGNIDGAPIVFGSMIDITIDNGGANNAVGDLLTITDGSGIGGKVRVTNVETATGRVTFTLVDGGYGYRLASNVYISDIIMSTNNYSNTSVVDGEPVQQKLQTVTYISGNSVPALYANLRGANSTNGTVSYGSVMSANATSVIVDVANGSFTNAATISVIGIFGGVPSVVTNTYANGTLMMHPANNATVALDAVTGTFYANGTLNFLTTNATATIGRLFTGNGTTFSIGSIQDTENIFLFTDFIGANNTSGTPYVNLPLNAANYAFPKLFSANVNTVLNAALASNTYTIGEISAISGINPGDNYNINPVVHVSDPLIVGYNRYPFIIQTANNNGGFLVGETITQTNSADIYTMNIANTNGTFTAGEGVWQNSIDAKGTISSVNSTVMVVTSLNGIAFQAGNTLILGQTSGANCKATTNVLSTSPTLARGKVLDTNATSVTVLPKSFNTYIATGRTIVGNTSGANAMVVSISEDTSREPMGNNAIVSANVVASNGIVSGVVVVDSGLGWRDGETVTLTNGDNPVAITGTIVADQNGSSEGFWRNNDGKLDSDKYIQDNFYYQEFAYEIQTGLSLEIYRDMLKKSFHMAGTEMFGKVIRISETDAVTNIESEVETS